MEKSVLQFESPKHQSSYIKVIGVGGGGTNAVNHMYEKGIEGVDFIICNTDNKSLDSSPVPTKIKLGKSGLGAGNIPAVARERAIEVGNDIKELLSHNTQMLFITAGMGGGTGTGAAPVIAKLAKEIELDDDVNKILVVAIVTLPFSFEGRRRRLQAEEGIDELRKYVDAILIINNDKLRDFGKMALREAFSKADDILLMAAKGIAEIITVKSYINIDFRDVNTVMQKSGVALMGAGIAEGENRALRAIEMATSSVLLNDSNIRGARSILFYLASGLEEIDMDEIGEITDYIQQEVGMDVDVIWGAGFDESLGSSLSVTLIATGFESKDIVPPGGIKPIAIEQPKGNPVKEDNILILDNEPTQATPVNVAVDIEVNTDISIELEPVLVKKNQEPVTFAPEQGDVTVLQPLATQLEEKMPLPSNAEEPFIMVKRPESIVVERKEEVPERTEVFSSQLLSAQKSSSYEEFVRERAQRMSLINSKLQNPQGVEELEKTPAFVTLGIDVKEPQHSSKSEVSRFFLDENAELKQENSFIYDQPD